MPPISILMAAYRAENFIAGTVRTVLAQTHADWELIIIGDDRQDYAAILAEQGIEDPRIRAITTPNLGPGKARNVGLDAARHCLITPLDHDDFWTADRLQRMLPHALTHGAVTTAVECIDGTGRLLHRVGHLMPEGLLDLKTHFQQNISSNHMLLFDRRRADLRWSNRFPEDMLLVAQCFDLLGQIYHLPNLFFRYVKQTGSVSNNLTTGARFIADKKAILCAIEDGLCFSRRSAADAFHHFMQQSLVAEQSYAAARETHPGLLFEQHLASYLSVGGV